MNKLEQEAEAELAYLEEKKKEVLSSIEDKKDELESLQDVLWVIEKDIDRCNQVVSY